MWFKLLGVNLDQYLTVDSHVVSVVFIQTLAQTSSFPMWFKLLGVNLD